jgi:hypothetical protein
MSLQPWSTAQVLSKLFDSMPEHVMKIFYADNKRNVRSFVWLAMMNKSLYRAIWSNMELVVAMMKASIDASCSMNRGAYDMLDIRYDNLAYAPAPIPRSLRADFLKYAKRSLHMQYMSWCGLCGRYGQQLVGEWQLVTRLCLGCRHANFITDTCLARDYGVTLATRFGGQLFAALIACKVAVHMVPYYDTSKLLHYTCDEKDVLLPPQGGKKSRRKQYMVLWRPHLERMLDLKGLKALQDMKRTKVLLLCGCIRRLFVRKDLWDIRFTAQFIPSTPVRALFRTDVLALQVATMRRRCAEPSHTMVLRPKKKVRDEKELIAATVESMRVAPFSAHMMC